jgi:hypothetical protein
MIYLASDGAPQNCEPETTDDNNCEQPGKLLFLPANAKTRFSVFECV